MFRLTSRTTPNKSARTGAPLYFIIHRMQGAYDGSVSWLCSSASQASADECVSFDGKEVCVLNWEAARMKTWEVGNANSLCIGWEVEGFEGQDESRMPDNLFDTLAARLIARQKTVKAVYGRTIPLRVTTRKGSAGITSHYQVAKWYGGSDHTDGQHFPWTRLQAAINRRQHPVVRVVKRVQYALEVIQKGKIVKHVEYGGNRVDSYLASGSFADTLKRGEVRMIRHRKGK